MLKKHIKWDITGKCNLRCKHCLTGEKYQKQQETLTHADRALIVNRLKAGGVHLINLLGGEPLLLGEDLLALSRHCDTIGVKMTLNTNGTLLTEKFTRQLLESGCKGFTVSLDGPTPEIHDQIRGKGTFQKTVENLQRLKEMDYFGHHVSLTINTVLTKQNMQAVDQMLDLVLSLGAHKWILLPLVITGFASDNEAELKLDVDDKIFTGNLLATRLHQFSQVYSPLEIDLQFSYPPLRKIVEDQSGLTYRDSQHCCMAGTTLGFIDPMGNLFACDRIATPEFNDISINDVTFRQMSLLKHDFSEIWNQPFNHELFTFVSSDTAYRNYYPCNRCEYLDQGLCIPCPLYGLKYSKITYDFCLKAEREIGPRALQLDDWIKREDFRYSGQFSTLGAKELEPVSLHTLGGIPVLHVRKSEWVRENIQWYGAELYDARQDKFYRLNFMGKEVWRHIGEGWTLPEILESAISYLPEQKKETFFQSGLALLEEMAHTGLVTIVV